MVLSKYSNKCVEFIKEFNNIIFINIDKNKLNKLFSNISISSSPEDKLYIETIEQPTKKYGELPEIAFYNNILDIQNLLIKDVKQELKRPSSKLYENPFISLDVINFIEQNQFYKYISSNCDSFITIRTPSKLTLSFELHLFSILSIMNNLSPNDHFLNLDIRLTPIKKHLYKLDGYISKYNMNSGSCYPTESVEIWRKEEFLKVLIHELIHFYQLDFNPRTKNYNKLINYLNNKFSINYKINPFEAFTDLLAILIHSYYVSKVLRLNTHDILKHEILWSCFQAAKLITTFGGKSFKDIFNLNIKQKSNGFSYYILKSALLVNINSVLIFLNSELKFNKPIEDFIKLIENSFNIKEYEKIINMMIKILLSNTQNSNYIITNFRMSCYELDF
jgi:hypothetical protein